jgi:ribose transport system substrate-binding protein
VGFAEAGSFVESRISGAFDGIRERLGELPTERFVQLDGRGMRAPSERVVSDWLKGRPKGERILVATATDSSALGVLDAARKAGREADFAIVGQDCIAEALKEMLGGKSALIGSISHEAASYGPRLIQLGISILRGYTVPPYNYVRHQVVTPESLAKGNRTTPTA